jgi:two-component system, NarL family, nitrate/nitrite response regulator NarL
MQLTRSSAIRLIIAEANELNCQLVQSAFRSRNSRVDVVATAVAYEGLFELLHEHKPDIVIVSVRLQEGPLEGYRVLRDLHLLRLNTRAIMLLDSRERELVVDAFRCGAHGIVFRDEPLETLGKCVQAVYQGQVWANSLHLSYVLEALTQTMPVKLQDARGADLLSKRQEDVVRLVSEGMTNREISQQLGLSEHTVRNYLFRVFDKLGVSTRVELVLYCLQNKQRSFPMDNGEASFGAVILSRNNIAIGSSKRQSGD